jgi:hypothetical protein
MSLAALKTERSIRELVLHHPHDTRVRVHTFETRRVLRGEHGLDR